MPYTLSMGLLWFAVALVLGVVVGAALRSVTARRQLASARSGSTDRDELDRLRSRVNELESALAAARAEAEAAEEAAEETDAAAPAATPAPSTATGPGTGDPAIVRDDLTVIEGLGPGVRDLCHGIGILTWADLADTETSLLRTMLDDAGARFQVHDPTTWREQARLLADGRWDEFRALAASIRSTPPSGRTP